MKYYRLDILEAKDPTGMATAAIRSCICCGRILCGSGGGAEYICCDCYNLLYSGHIGALLRKERNNRDSIFYAKLNS